MKNLLSIIFIFFVAYDIYAQSPNTPPILFSSRFQITNAVNGTGDTIVISGYTDDCTTRFSNSDIAIGDSLYVLEGTDLLIFGVVTTRTISLGIATFKVRDFNGAGLLPSNGQAAIFRPTTDYDFPGYVCGLNDGLQQYISDRFRQNLDAALSAGSTDSTIYATVYRLDTASQAIRNEIAALPATPSSFAVVSSANNRLGLAVLPGTGTNPDTLGISRSGFLPGQALNPTDEFFGYDAASSTNALFTAQNIIDLTQDSAVDRSITNEGALSVGAAGATTSQIATNTSGDGGVILKAGGINALSESADTITITATEVDGSTTNELDNLDAAYNNFGASASKIIVDAAQSQTGGFEIESSGSQNIIFDNQGTGEIQLQDGGNILLKTTGSGEVGIGGNIAGTWGAEKTVITGGLRLLQNGNTTANSDNGSIRFLTSFGVGFMNMYDNTSTVRITLVGDVGSTSYINSKYAFLSTSVADAGSSTNYSGRFSGSLGVWFDAALVRIDRQVQDSLRSAGTKGDVFTSQGAGTRWKWGRAVDKTTVTESGTTSTWNAVSDGVDDGLILINNADHVAQLPTTSDTQLNTGDEVTYKLMVAPTSGSTVYVSGATAGVTIDGATNDQGTWASQYQSKTYRWTGSAWIIK